MQVLVVLAPGHGHLYPTFGVAGALRATGHTITYAMVDEPSLREGVEREGHSFVPVPPSLIEQREIVGTGLRNDPSLAGIFGGLAPPAVAPLVSLIAGTSARLVLHDMASFAAPLAAEIGGVPSVHRGRAVLPPRRLRVGGADGATVGAMGQAAGRACRDVPASLLRPLPPFARQPRQVVPGALLPLPA
ncbi:MAG TPA: hypothetical protein VK425_04520 [Acidimicrobiales bacterium]|nr:hypothetical protein [Acidimicrobiales bacterium]